MKLRIPIIASLAFTAVVSIVSLANLNSINLLLNGSDYGESSSLDQFNVNGEEEKTYNPTVDGLDGSALGESLQSGLAGSGSGTGGLNLLWILQNAKDPDKSSYAYQLLEAYSNLENDKYNNFEYHIPPSVVAASHKNETNLASFVTPSTEGYAVPQETIIGKSINGKVITLENATKSDIIGNVSNNGKGVFYNESGKGDSCHDGPLQIIQCEPLGNGDHSVVASKVRGDGKYDLYSFVDALNVKDYKFNNVAKPFFEGDLSIDPVSVNMLSSITHNRGEAGGISLMFGFGYNGSSAKTKKFLHRPASSYKNMEQRDLKVATAFPDKLMKWLNASNIPLEDIPAGNAGAQGLATLITLANGGFLDIPVMKTSKANILAQPDSIIGLLFPGKDRTTIIDHINSNYVKKPWDEYGISRQDFHKQFGTGELENYEVEYATFYNLNRNTVFYIHDDVMTDNYKVGERRLLTAVEGIALGYIAEAGFTGEYTLLQIALTAGINSLTDGTVVDPTNPQTVYQKMAPESSGAFNPATAADGNFGAFLDYLGLTGTLSEGQQAQMKVLYDVSGGTYSQGKRGTLADSGLYYLDCSSMASVGIHLKPGLKGDALLDTAEIWNGKWLTSQGTADYGGKSYDIRAVQLDLNGKPGTNTKVDSSWAQSYSKWKDKLITGDIIVVRTSSSGHVAMYGGKNTTDKAIIIPPDISKVKTIHSKVGAGEHFQIQSISTTYYNGLTGYWPRYPKDRPGEEHRVFRPVYNVR